MKSKIMNIDFPKISCLTVTKNKLAYLKQAIHCFMQQTYPNKELIIFSKGDAFFNAAIQRFLNAYPSSDISFYVTSDKQLSMNELRNSAWDSAKGDIICLWESYNQYHPRRLEIQYAHMKEQEAQASYLVEQLQLLRQDQILFFTDWATNAQSAQEQLIPESLMVNNFSTIRFPIPQLQDQEEGQKELISQILSLGLHVAGLNGEAGLFLHQQLTSDAHEKQQVLDQAIERSSDKEKVMQQLPAIYEALQQYNVPMPLSIYSGKEQIGIYERI